MRCEQRSVRKEDGRKIPGPRQGPGWARRPRSRAPEPGRRLGEAGGQRAVDGQAPGVRAGVRLRVRTRRLRLQAPRGPCFPAQSAGPWVVRPPAAVTVHGGSRPARGGRGTRVSGRGHVGGVSERSRAQCPRPKRICCVRACAPGGERVGSALQRREQIRRTSAAAGCGLFTHGSGSPLREPWTPRASGRAGGPPEAFRSQVRSPEA